MTISLRGTQHQPPSAQSSCDLNPESSKAGYVARIAAFFHPSQQIMATRDDIRREMEANARALAGERVRLMARHPDAFVLMRGGQIVDLFPTIEEARAAGRARFPNRLFSLHHLSASPRRAGAITHI